MKVSNRLLAAASLAHGVAYIYAASDHVQDPSWPLHARFHVLQAILWIVGLDLVLALLAARRPPPFKGLDWAAFALGGAAAHGGYFIAVAALPTGAPPDPSAHVILGSIALLYVVGLLLAWRSPGPS